MTLQVYEWEWRAFPWQYHVEVRPQYRVPLTRALAKYFKLGDVLVLTDKRSGGCATPGLLYSTIRLPAPGSRCKLGLIVHELAHISDRRRSDGCRRGNYHRASFKDAVARMQIAVRAYRLLPPIFAAIRKEAAAARERVSKEVEAAQRRAQRAQELKDLKKTVPYKLARAQERARRLRTRLKRVATALRKAERQERLLARRAAPVETVSVGG